MAFTIVIQIIAALLLIVIAAEDWHTKQIHDVLLMCLMICGISMLLADVAGFTSVQAAGAGTHKAPYIYSVINSRVLGALCISIPMALINLVACGSFGVGDICICIGAGLMLGATLMIKAACIAMIGAGAYAAILLISGKAGRKDTIAYGPFLSAGILIVMTMSG